MALAPLIKNVPKKHAEPSPTADKSLKITFDLKDVDFISSAFIRICMVTAAALKSGNLILQNACPFIKNNQGQRFGKLFNNFIIRFPAIA